MPTYVPGEQSPASFPYAAQHSSYLNFDKHPNLQVYQHFVIPRDPELISGRGIYVAIITKTTSLYLLKALR